MCASATIRQIDLPAQLDVRDRSASASERPRHGADLRRSSSEGALPEDHSRFDGARGVERPANMVDERMCISRELGARRPPRASRGGARGWRRGARGAGAATAARRGRSAHGASRAAVRPLRQELGEVVVEDEPVEQVRGLGEATLPCPAEPSQLLVADRGVAFGGQPRPASATARAGSGRSRRSRRPP